MITGLSENYQNKKYVNIFFYMLDFLYICDLMEIGEHTHSMKIYNFY